MSGHRKPERSEEARAEVMALLSALAGRGRHIPVPATHAAEVMVRGAPPDTPFMHSIAAFRAARARGWIAPSTGYQRLGLTPAGREALRRWRAGLAASRASDASPDASGTSPAPAPHVNSAESPLAWLAGRRDASGRPMLTTWEAEAGERLRADITFAGLSPRVTMSWTGIPIARSGRAANAVHGPQMTDTVIAARARVTAALRAVGPEFVDILIDVCGNLRGLEEIARNEGWPRRAARLLLQRALSALARHYRIAPEVSVEEAISRRLRHWGSDDYRPTLARWKNGGTQAD